VVSERESLESRTPVPADQKAGDFEAASAWSGPGRQGHGALPCSVPEGLGFAQSCSAGCRSSSSRPCHWSDHWVGQLPEDRLLNYETTDDGHASDFPNPPNPRPDPPFPAAYLPNSDGFDGHGLDRQSLRTRQIQPDRYLSVVQP